MRTIGLLDIPAAGRRLIAGLDPAISGYQAAVLWAVVPTRRLDRADHSMMRYIVDIDNRLGGGIDHAVELFWKWHEMYKLEHWVVESNMWGKGFSRDSGVVDFKERTGTHFEGDQTGRNKNDPSLGVAAMSKLFPDMVDLPYGDEESRTKSNELKRQAMRFVDNSERQRRNKSDVLMAAWFPQKTIRRWEKEAYADASQAYVEESYEFGVAYPELTDSSDVPWAQGYL